MVVHDGLVKITDFGIARMRTNEVKTMTGMILGSPKYMSPEQVTGKRADHRSDIFSLGVVLYEMLTGEAPFQADSIHGIMYQIMQLHAAAAEHAQPAAARRRRSHRRQGARTRASRSATRTRDDLARDLRECRNTLLGLASGPRARWPTPAAASRRRPPPRARSDKLRDRESRARQSGVPKQETKPALALSKAFDSFDATMRLAALTGMDKELRRALAATPEDRGGSTPSPSAARRSLGGRSARDPQRAVAPQPRHGRAAQSRDLCAEQPTLAVAMRGARLAESRSRLLRWCSVALHVRCALRVAESCVAVELTSH